MLITMSIPSKSQTMPNPVARFEFDTGARGLSDSLGPLNMLANSWTEKYINGYYERQPWQWFIIPINWCKIPLTITLPRVDIKDCFWSSLQWYDLLKFLDWNITKSGHSWVMMMMCVCVFCLFLIIIMFIWWQYLMVSACYIDSWNFWESLLFLVPMMMVSSHEIMIVCSSEVDGWPDHGPEVCVRPLVSLSPHWSPLLDLWGEIMAPLGFQSWLKPLVSPRCNYVEANFPPLLVYNRCVLA